MQTADVFRYGIGNGLRQWRIAAIVYGLQLCLALILGMQVYEVLEASIGHSLEVKKLLSGYDHTVFTDFLKVHGASLAPLIGQLRWVLPVWMLFSVFLNGGMLVCAASPDTASGRLFWQGGASYFFPFLKIGLIFLALAAVWSVVVLAPLAAFLEPALERLPSEQYAVWGVLGLLTVWGAGLGLLYVWSVLSRLQHWRQGTSAMGSLPAGWRAFRQSRGRALVVWAGFAGAQVALTLGYWGLEASGGMTTPAMIVVFFGVQQAFVFLRVLLRQMAFGALAAV